MPIISVLLYLCACVVCAIMGRSTAVGFWGHFLLALLVTPLGDLVIQLVGRPCRRIRDQIADLPRR